MTTTLEQAARTAWIVALDGYAKFTACSCCGEVKPCRSRRGRRFICLECWDQERQ